MEKTWKYNCDLVFSGQKITKFTITDHFQIKHPEISLELVVKLVNKLNEQEVELTDYQGNRKAFKWGGKISR